MREKRLMSRYLTLVVSDINIESMYFCDWNQSIAMNRTQFIFKFFLGAHVFRVLFLSFCLSLFSIIFPIFYCFFSVHCQLLRACLSAMFENRLPAEFIIWLCVSCERAKKVSAKNGSVWQRYSYVCMCLSIHPSHQCLWSSPLLRYLSICLSSCITSLFFLFF